jgi:hypothetical protein
MPNEGTFLMRHAWVRAVASLFMRTKQSRMNQPMGELWKNPCILQTDRKLDSAIR